MPRNKANARPIQYGRKLKLKYAAKLIDIRAVEDDISEGDLIAAADWVLCI